MPILCKISDNMNAADAAAAARQTVEAAGDNRRPIVDDTNTLPSL